MEPLPSVQPSGTEPSASDAERCAVCGREVGNLAFCHIYHEGRKITLCGPACAELFLHRTDQPPADGEPPVSDHVMQLY
jgi:hypothetical protein